MTLADLIALASGILLEILVLWDLSESDKPRHPGLLAPRLSRLQEWIGLTALLSWLVVSLLAYFDPPIPFSILDSLSGGIMFVSFSFLFVFGMVVPRLMPRVSEQTVVGITLVVLLGLWPQLQAAPALLAALALPSLALLGLALRDQAPHPILQSLVYFWYLICLFITAAQNNFNLFFTPGGGASGLFDFYLAGAAGIFLLLHAIFLVRFFLMLAALVLPRNRPYLLAVMPQLFRPEQMPRPRFVLLLALAAAVLLANQFFGFTSPIALTHLLILVIVQWKNKALFT